MAEAEGAIDAGMDSELDEEDFAFSRSYFLAKEIGGASKRKSAPKVSDINPVDEQVTQQSRSHYHQRESSSGENK